MSKKIIVVLTGAGISAESGIQTFRDNDGLWEGNDIMKVASPQGWLNNKALVLDFYNKRRKQAREVSPNEAHFALATLEASYNVQIITQNVDDLHERAGSTQVLHLHGMLEYARSTKYPELIYKLDHWEMKPTDICEKGYPLRPHIVWFGEEVPMYTQAVSIIRKADIVCVVGTSLQVYPAAGLLHEVLSPTPIYIIDPGAPAYIKSDQIHAITMKATQGVPYWIKTYLDK